MVTLGARCRLAAFGLSIGVLAGCEWEAVPRPPTSQIPARFRMVYVAGLDSLDHALMELATLPASTGPGAAAAALHRARSAYKRVEYWVEYGRPEWLAGLNAPPLPVPDEDDPSAVIEPAGLQLLETALSARPTPPRLDTIVERQVSDMRRLIGFIREDSSYGFESPGTAFDAARTELARVVTLGLVGFDAGAPAGRLPESADALRGVRNALSVYEADMRTRDSSGWAALSGSLEAGIAALDSATDFDRFDRFEFLVRRYNPIAADLARLRASLRLPDSATLASWSPGATNIYAPGAIDARWFAPDYAPPPTPQLVALGRRLFFDPSLSRSGRRSCATCHRPELAFTDGRALASVDAGHGRVRNTPTLLNAGLHRRQFADQRVMFLEFQFEDVMANPREMGLSHDSAARKLSADSTLVASFAAVLGKPPAQALTGQTLSIAVAAYVRSLQALDSRFDRAVAGDTAVLSPSERRGFNLFMGKAACATCHFAPLFNGSMPPTYREAEPEVIGVPAVRAIRRARIDPDPGVFARTRAPLHRHAFKTPTVRNAAPTAPYMHNGVYRTLEQVVDFYDRGGGNGIGMKLPNQTLSAEPLRLTAEEKRDLVDFMGALTDTAAASVAGVDAR